MKVLVIGGSRFSGRYTVKQLLKDNHDVTVLNRGKSEIITTPFYVSETLEYPKGVKIIHADRTKQDEFSNALKNNDFEIIIDTCAFNEKDIQSVIDIATDKLQQYIFVSTGSVYDEKKIIFYPIDEDDIIGSEAEDFPETYSRDKRRAESRLKKEFIETGFPMTIFRPTYIYGPYNPMYREFYFFDRIEQGKTIYMPGSGEYLSDFVHAKDIAQLITNSIDNKKAIGQAYNATGTGGLTLNNYVSLVSDIVGKEIEIIHYDPIIFNDETMKPDNWNQMFPFMFNIHFVMNQTKSIVDLNYKPIPLKEGLEETYQWYKTKKNPEWKGDYGFDEKLITKLNENSNLIL
ncbi:MAG: NAD-dependent epimerase/dehydratase family protein [Asgard group archaeon]|nr:NAD-dependent epimerase/dehydratase family protein [Asgard group archaeon]